MEQHAFDYGFLCGKHNDATTQFMGDFPAELIEAFLRGFEEGQKENKKLLTF